MYLTTFQAMIHRYVCCNIAHVAVVCYIIYYSLQSNHKGIRDNREKTCRKCRFILKREFSKQLAETPALRTSLYPNMYLGPWQGKLNLGGHRDTGISSGCSRTIPLSVQTMFPSIRLLSRRCSCELASRYEHLYKLPAREHATSKTGIAGT